MTGDVFLVPFFPTEMFCLADFMEGIYEILEFIREIHSVWTRKLFN